MTTESPGFRALVMSPELLPPPIHTPERSGVPSGRCGAGPVTLGGWRNNSDCAASEAAMAAVMAIAQKRFLDTRTFYANFRKQKAGFRV